MQAFYQKFYRKHNNRVYDNHVYDNRLYDNLELEAMANIAHNSDKKLQTIE